MNRGPAWWHGGLSTRTLDRKLYREMRDSALPCLAIAAVIAAGVAVFVMALSTLAFLNESRDAYYERNRFADVFASLRRAPQDLVAEIERIPGVAVAESRVVGEVTLEVPGLAEPATGRMISLSEDRHQVASRPGSGGLPPGGLNRVHLVRGRWPDRDAADEVIAGLAFVVANNLDLGSELRGVIHGRQQRLRIVGVGLSPEYVFQIRSGDFLPDDRRFGVFWAPRRQLEAAFDLQSAFNDISLRLVGGTQVRPVIASLDRLLRPYGGIGAYGREDQLSARFLDDEIRQLRATGLIVPLIFLAVAAFLLHLVLARRIDLQREAIATLKAFGYSGFEISRHFLKFALVVSIVGAAVGGVGGSWLAAELCQLYSGFFRFPSFDFRPYPQVIGAAVFISLAAASAGAIFAVRRVVRLQPAEAMRPAVPPRYHRGLVDLLWGWLRLPTPAVMVLRRLVRRPLATGFSAVGIGSATAVLMVSGFAVAAVEEMIDMQFAVTQRQDLRITFRETSASPSIQELRNLEGVLRVESFRAIPVRLLHGHRERRVSILGLEEETALGGRPELFRLVDTDGQSISLPPGGLVLSDKLAELLDVRPGQAVWVEVLIDRRQRFRVPVVGLAKEYVGTNAYAQRATLHRWLQEGRRADGAFLAIDSERESALYDALREYPMVLAVSSRSAALEAIRGTVRENQAKMQGFQAFFAGIIALGVVYNMARLTLAEQRRELATMRVIGFSRSEVSAIFLGEVLTVTAIAIPLGWMIGAGLCFGMVKAFESELYRIPFVIGPRSLILSAWGTGLAAVASGLVVRRSIDRLDLISALQDSR
ncbi:MAG: ABC transporter permease [Planctomycetaceae bacterium]|nr:MAG: ABC transporter permease [Planctomycetaceae bacterium]